MYTYIYIYNISIYVYTYREREIIFEATIKNDQFRARNFRRCARSQSCTSLFWGAEIRELRTAGRIGSRDSFRNLSEIYRKEYRLDRNLVINFGDTSPFSPWVQLGLWVPWDSPHAQARWHWPTRAPGSARCGLSHWSSLGQGTRDFRRFLVIGVPNFDPYLCWWIKIRGYTILVYWG